MTSCAGIAMTTDVFVAFKNYTREGQRPNTHFLSHKDWAGQRPFALNSRF
jgi:hypothetical protein